MARQELQEYLSSPAQVQTAEIWASLESWRFGGQRALVTWVHLGVDIEQVQVHLALPVLRQTSLLLQMQSQVVSSFRHCHDRPVSVSMHSMRSYIVTTIF